MLYHTSFLYISIFALFAMLYWMAEHELRKNSSQRCLLFHSAEIYPRIQGAPVCIFVITHRRNHTLSATWHSRTTRPAFPLWSSLFAPLSELWFSYYVQFSSVKRSAMLVIVLSRYLVYISQHKMNLHAGGNTGTCSKYDKRFAVKMISLLFTEPFPEILYSMQNSELPQNADSGAWTKLWSWRICLSSTSYDRAQWKLRTITAVKWSVSELQCSWEAYEVAQRTISSG